MKKVKLLWIFIMTVVGSALLGGAGGRLWMRDENTTLAVVLLLGMVVVLVAGLWAYSWVKARDEG